MEAALVVYSWDSESVYIRANISYQLIWVTYKAFSVSQAVIILLVAACYHLYVFHP